MVYLPLLLDCAPLEKMGGWTLQGEDPSLYTQDQLWKGGRREWPDEPLPGYAPAGATPQGASTSQEPETPESEPNASSRGPHHPPDEQVKQMLDIHHSMVKLLKSMGVDPCKDFEETRLELILDNLDSTDLDCKVCGKHYTRASKMKNHMRKRHLGKTKWQCDICKKYYTDSSSLKYHVASHDKSKFPHKCSKCTKAYPTEAKLNSICLCMGHHSMLAHLSPVTRSSSGKRARRSTCPSASTILMLLRIHLTNARLAPRPIGTRDLSRGITRRSLSTKSRSKRFVRCRAGPCAICVATCPNCADMTDVLCVPSFVRLVRLRFQLVRIPSDSCAAPVPLLTLPSL